MKMKNFLSRITKKDSQMSEKPVDSGKGLNKKKAANREKCIEKAMEKRGWTREEASEEVDKTVKRLGITFNEYREQNFCMLSEKDQDTKAVYLKEKKEETKVRNDELVKSTMNKTGWSKVNALKDMNRVKTELGVDYEEYDKYDFALVSEDNQKVKYDKLKKVIEKDKKARNKRNLCIWKTMWIRGIDRNEAIAEVDETVEKLGLSYEEYDNFHLNRYEPEDKEWAVASMRETAAKQKENLKRNIAGLVESHGLTEREINEMFAKYNREYGCMWGEFFTYKVYDLDEETISKMFFMGYMNRLMKKYNKDKIVTRISINKEWTNHFLEKYITRKWCVNRDITLEEFKNLFADGAGVVYKPNYGFQARGVQVLYFNGDIEGVYNKVMSYSRGVVEEIIKQHPDMKKLSPESVNCMRIVSISTKNGSVLADGTKKDIAYVSLKIGRNGNIVDNVIAGGMVANVDLETGCVATHGVNHDLQVLENHPDTGTQIKGFKIPYFKEALQLVYTVIEEKGLCGTIGWDMAIGENGPEIVEPNFGPAASLLQDPYWPEKKGMKEVMSKYLWDEE